MLIPGLVSVSFRSLSPREIVALMNACGLQSVEWGSDVHARCDDPDALRAIAQLQRDTGVTCCSYGTYFRLGADPAEGILPYIAAARTLGTDILRVWCGHQSYAKYTPSEKTRLLDACRAVARIAQEEGVTVCLECHHNTYTEELPGALELMEAVQSDHFRMYWQPNQYKTQEINLEYARRIAPYVTQLHVFHWEGDAHYPLALGMNKWLEYLPVFTGDHHLLLEFMPDGRPESLAGEVHSLRALIAQTGAQPETR